MLLLQEYPQERCRACPGDNQHTTTQKAQKKTKKLLYHTHLLPGLPGRDAGHLDRLGPLPGLPAEPPDLRRGVEPQLLVGFSEIFKLGLLRVRTKLGAILP